MHNASTGTEMATTTTAVARAALVALLLLAVALVQSTGKCFEHFFIPILFLPLFPFNELFQCAI